MPPKRRSGQSQKKKEAKKRVTRSPTKELNDESLAEVEIERSTTPAPKLKGPLSIFETLPADIFSEIVGFLPKSANPAVRLTGTRVKWPLKNLSLTGPLMRDKCLRDLYYVFRLPLTSLRELEDLDHTWLLVHATEILVDVDTPGRDLSELALLFYKIAERCGRLLQFTIICSDQPTSSSKFMVIESLHSLIQAAQPCPKLQRLRIQHFKWTLPSAPYSNHIPSLTRFEFVRSRLNRRGIAPAWSDEPYDPPTNREEAAALEWLLSASHSKLENLSLPGTISPIKAMAGWHWPALTELKIIGTRPLPSDGETSLKGMLIESPNLRSLIVCLAYAAPRTSKFLVCSDSHPGPTSPVDDSVDLAVASPSKPGKKKKPMKSRKQSSAPSSPSQGSARHLAPQVEPGKLRRSPRLNPPTPPVLQALNHLSVSNPSKDDLLWDMLSNSLTSLSLLGFPHFQGDRHRVEFTPEGRVSIVPIPSTELLAILQRIPTEFLTTLRISFWSGDRNVELIDHIVGSCPLLHTLEVHCNHDSDRFEDLMPLCGQLTALVNLRELFLDLLFPDTYNRMARIAQVLADDEDLTETEVIEEEPTVISTYIAHCKERASLIMEYIPHLLVAGLALDEPTSYFYWLIFRRTAESGNEVELDDDSISYRVAEY